MDRREKIIYMAGFFDGEGNVGTPNRHHLYIGASQVDPRPLERLEELFGGKIYPHHQEPKFQERKWKPAWRWLLTGRAAGAALEEMLPYLIVKHDVAELGIALARLSGNVNGRWERDPNPERRIQQEKIADSIRRLIDYRGGKARRPPVDDPLEVPQIERPAVPFTMPLDLDASA